MSLTRQQCRDIDRHAIEQLGIPSIVLMENAGRGTVDVLLEQDPECRTVLVLCGKGNNGGDGFVIARHLAIHGVDVHMVLLAKCDDLVGDARINCNILCASGLGVLEISTVDELDAIFNKVRPTWLIDALLGTGATGEPREPYASVIEWMNRQPARRLAVDVPSGLDCDAGQPATPTVRADLTCTFVGRKVGYDVAAAQEYLGEVHVVSIGIVPSDPNAF